MDKTWLCNNVADASVSQMPSKQPGQIFCKTLTFQPFQFFNLKSIQPNCIICTRLTLVSAHTRDTRIIATCTFTRWHATGGLVSQFRAVSMLKAAVNF